MKVENLESIWRQEKRDEEFASLPFHYLEISSLLLSVAPDDMGPDCDRMRTLLEDIENVRQGKMYKGMGDAAMRLDGAIKVSFSACNCDLLEEQCPVSSHACG
jgi:GINS complex protein